MRQVLFGTALELFFVLYPQSHVSDYVFGPFEYVRPSPARVPVMDGLHLT